MVMFHSYVSLPEGSYYGLGDVAIYSDHILVTMVIKRMKQLITRGGPCTLDLSKRPCSFVYPHTWWLIPLSKWVITPGISGLTLLIPFITGVITHILSGMSHQV